MDWTNFNFVRLSYTKGIYFEPAPLGEDEFPFSSRIVGDWVTPLTRSGPRGPYKRRAPPTVVDKKKKVKKVKLPPLVLVPSTPDIPTPMEEGAAPQYHPVLDLNDPYSPPHPSPPLYSPPHSPKSFWKDYDDGSTTEDELRGPAGKEEMD